MKNNLKKCFAIGLAAIMLVSCGPKGADGNDAKEKVPFTNPIADLKREVIFPKFEETSVEAAVPEYSVAEDLSNISNINDYINDYFTFNEEQTKALVENKFFVDGSRAYEQPFEVYEGNEYGFLPNFVTADSLLHLFHISYDGLLRELEVKKFMPRLIEVSRTMAIKSLEDYNNAKDPVVKELAKKNAAYFVLAEKLFGEEFSGELPQEVKDLVEKEYKNIEAMSKADSNLVAKAVDYSQFKPRGHYTRSEELKKYFRGAMLFSQEAMIFYDDEGKPIDENIIQGLMMAKNLVGDEESFKKWEDVNDSVNFLVENSEDVDPYLMGQVYFSHFDKNTDVDELANEKNLKKVHKTLDQLPKPKIQYYEDTSFRFMPQRAVLDNVWAQNLLDTNRPSKRPIYSGLDIMGVMGNKVAEEMVLSNEQNKKWDEFENRYQETKEMAKVLDDGTEGRKNIYRSWLWMLKSYEEEIPESFPEFMKSKAWAFKDLNAQLGSWAQLKHDTILYGKQAGAEMGGGEEEEKEMPKSYVEPRVHLYDRMIWAMNYMKENLKSRELLTEANEKNMNNFIEMVDFLRKVSVAELKNETIDSKDQERLLYIGGEMENIFIKFVDEKAEYFAEIEEQADRNMATVADLMVTVENTVGIEPNKYLEVGSGMAQEMFVVYQIGDKLIMGTGPVYAYYEFLSDERMTDEDFQNKIYDSLYSPDAKNPLVQPIWTEIYIKDTVYDY
ncbi:MAG: DUF3160 domain-containing protein [Peptoniphilus duerdenii]|uniref:DUF3160 domain-containing protein n=1 Tax=Peptoniphilus duerdenii TaxID=507750 RepID=UPI00254C2C77|nr:DUF3160 domain-containing protein [Peptoniphilus duerdenii]MDK8276160.1 DUF3160 domain-containing protein [Peptoniphilus duerdenii]